MQLNRTKLKLLRGQARLTQPQLAERAGVSAWSVGAWEQGKFRPNPLSLAALARALGVEPEELLEQPDASARETPRHQKDPQDGASRGESDAVR